MLFYIQFIKTKFCSSNDVNFQFSKNFKVQTLTNKVTLGYDTLKIESQFVCTLYVLLEICIL